MAGSTNRNLLLDTLAPDVLAALHPHEQHHPITTILIAQDEMPKFVFFPHAGAVVSIIRSTENGTMVEAGVVGNEGAFSVQTVITAPAPTGSQALVQIDGRFTRVDAPLLRELFADDVPFRDHCLAFTSLFLDQITQNLVCNRLHPIEERLAKWLLIIRDRIATDDLHLTQDFLAHMLGIHRPGVSIAIAALSIDGLIAHSRSLVTIRDRPGLEQHSCECHRAIKASLQNFRSNLAARTFGSIPTRAFGT